jgi:hypothetical protein
MGVFDPNSIWSTAEDPKIAIFDHFGGWNAKIELFGKHPYPNLFWGSI